MLGKPIHSAKVVVIRGKFPLRLEVDEALPAPPGVEIVEVEDEEDAPEVKMEGAGDITDNNDGEESGDTKLEADFTPTAAASFVEMPKKVIQNYIKFIKKFETKEISLISYDGSFDSTFNPQELNTFFENKLNISWKNFLIEEYERKLIYYV